MMTLILPQTLTMIWNPKNKNFYEKKGYKFTNFKNKFEINVHDLSKGSKFKVNVRCDFCNSTKFKRIFSEINRSKRKNPNYKDVCRNCIGSSMKERVNKTPILEVEKYLFEYGLILIKESYKSASKPLNYICKKHKEYGEQSLIFSAFKHNRTKYQNGNGCKYCYRKSNSGENSRFWKGGVTPEHKLIRASEEYDKWREKIFLKDNYTCQACGASEGIKLHAHHVLNFSTHPKLRFDVKNGITFCFDCHDYSVKGSFHDIYGTTKNTKEQVEEYIKYKKSIGYFPVHTVRPKKGRVSAAKFTDEEVLEIRERLTKGESVLKISEEKGVYKSVIYKIKYGESYKDITKEEKIPYNKHYSAVLNMNEAKEIRGRMERGENPRKLAEEYDVNYKNIILPLKRGETYKEITKGIPLKLAFDKITNQKKCTKFTDDEVRDIRKRLTNGEKVIEISKIYNCGRHTISRIKNNQTYTYVE